MVGLDYGFFIKRGESEEGATPVLCGKCSTQKWFYAIAMPSKGIENPWNVKATATTIARAGYARLIIRTDTENPILALKRSVGQILTKDYGSDIILEDGSVGDSAQRGERPRGARGAGDQS